MVEVAVVVEMVDEVATPAEPEAMAVVNAVVNTVGVTEVTWVETEEEERTELVSRQNATNDRGRARP